MFCKRRLERAIGYILDSKNKKRLWGEDEDDYEAETTGIMFQIGPYLMKTHPDEYREIMYQLGKIEIKRKYTGLYLAMTGIELFSKEEQQTLFKLLREDKTKFEEMEKIDLCYGLVQKFKNNIGLLQYYNYLNRAHELVQPEAMNGKKGKDIQAEYIKWCEEQLKKFRQCGECMKAAVVDITKITNKTELWYFCELLFQKYKFSIEEKGGWKGLWNGDKHVLEKEVQNHFWNYMNAFGDGHAISVSREKYTGAGLVDFEFSNGHKACIQVEFKLSGNNGLQRDGGLSQINQYMTSTETDTAFLVVFGFDERDKENIGKIKSLMQQFRLREPGKFIELIFIDASKKRSASRQYIQ